jgi:hypothetical protein
LPLGISLFVPCSLSALIFLENRDFAATFFIKCEFILAISGQVTPISLYFSLFIP